MLRRDFRRRPHPTESFLKRHLRALSYIWGMVACGLTVVVLVHGWGLRVVPWLLLVVPFAFWYSHRAP